MRDRARVRNRKKSDTPYSPVAIGSHRRVADPSLHAGRERERERKYCQSGRPLLRMRVEELVFCIYIGIHAAGESDSMGVQGMYIQQPVGWESRVYTAMKLHGSNEIYIIAVRARGM